MAVNRDFKDLLRILNEENAKYLLIGAYAVSFYSEPRYTKDMDLWIASDKDNVENVWQALTKFGAPLQGISKEDLSDPETIYQIGIEPNRVDILVQPVGLKFSEAWARRLESDYDGEKLCIVSREDLMVLKKAAGREKDLRDLELLKKHTSADKD